jgi:hypothetical protein
MHNYVRVVRGYYTSRVERGQETTKMGIIDTGNNPAAPDPLPPEGTEISTDPAALPAAEEAIDSEINESARVAADAPIPEPAIPFHPAAGILPKGDDASIRELARSIGGNDPIDRIILYKGKILDRPDLYLACLLARREPTFETYAGAEPLRFLINRQVRRGYLDESQRAMLGARACELPIGGNQYSEGLSIGRASKWLNVSPESISRAKKVLARGIPELVKVLDNGTLSVGKAFGIAKLPESEQRTALDHIAGYKPPAVEVSNSPMLPSGETSDAQVEASATDNATGSAEVEAETPAAGQPKGSSSPPSTTMPSTAAVTVSSRRILYNDDEWIWPGYVPTSAVTVIAGGITAPTALLAVKISATVIAGGGWPGWHSALAWLSAQPKVERTLHNQVLAAGGMIDGVDLFCHVHPLEAAIDDYGLPIHHLARALWLLDQEIQTKGNVQVAVVDYLFPYVASGVEQNIARLQRAFAAMNEIAVKHHFALVALCPFPYRGGRDEIAQATAALADIPEVHSLLFVEGADHGTIMPTKIVSGARPTVVKFRTGKRPGYSEPSVSAIIFENGWKQLIPNRKPRRKRSRPGRRGKLSNIRP